MIRRRIWTLLSCALVLMLMEQLALPAYAWEPTGMDSKQQPTETWEPEGMPSKRQSTETEETETEETDTCDLEGLLDAAGNIVDTATGAVLTKLDEQHLFIHGKCVICGYECLHEQHDMETGLCLTCGLQQYHTYESLQCTGCGRWVEMANNWPDMHWFAPCAHQGRIDEASVMVSDDAYKNIEIYVPYGYDPTKQYNVLFLMSGEGGTPDAFTSRVNSYSGAEFPFCMKDLYDNLIEAHRCRPLLIVSFCDRTIFTEGYNMWDSIFQEEDYLLNGIIPYIVTNYATYASDASRQSLHAARDHFGMGGFSNGSYMSYYVGMENMGDVFSNFIPMSGSLRPSSIVKQYNEGEFAGDPINFYFVSTGTIDKFRDISQITYETISGGTNCLEDGRNAHFLLVNSGHNLKLAAIGLFNALQMVFPEVSG